MGLFPYQTTVEHNRTMRDIRHFHEFCELKGYTKLFDSGFGPHPWQDADGMIRTESSRPWVGKNGKSYMDREEFKKDNGWYPYLIKDGVCYGMFEPKILENYIDPWEAEVKFLASLGYTRVPYGSLEFSEDYDKNYDLSEKFYQDNGWFPRWIKDKKHFGHEELLLMYNYEYVGEPPFPTLIEEDKKPQKHFS